LPFAAVAYNSCWDLARIGGSALAVAKKDHFSLIFAPVVHNHLGAIDAKYDSLIREKIEEQLTYEPDVETRNRKPVRAPAAFQAEWELRFGPNNRFRVFYQIDHEKREVRIVAVGVKDRNRLLVGGEEVTL
jgi:mRNA-degrading endonuclease RelE of RelBE toxin-antitoxin system